MLFALRRQELFELIERPDPGLLEQLIEGSLGLKEICTKSEFKNLIIYLSLNSIREDPNYASWSLLRGRLKAFNFIKDSLLVYCSGVADKPAVPHTLE
jgi:hypothetical protein